MGGHGRDDQNWFAQFRAPVEYNPVQKGAHYFGIGFATLLTAVLALGIVWLVVWGVIKLFGAMFG